LGKLQYFDAELNQNYVPYVVETSVGLQNVLGSFATSLKEETLEDGSTRTVLNYLGSTKAAILPLVKRFA
jgi:glycyl-tRNA synthetase